MHSYSNAVEKCVFHIEHSLVLKSIFFFSKSEEMLAKCGFHVEHSGGRAHQGCTRIHSLAHCTRCTRVHSSTLYTVQAGTPGVYSNTFGHTSVQCTRCTWDASVAKHIASHNTNSTEGPLHGLGAYTQYMERNRVWRI